MRLVSVSEWLRRASATALDPVDTGILRLAADRERVRPSELAEYLDVNPSTITRHVKVLADHGEVVLCSDEADGRASLVALTDRGWARLHSIYESGVNSFLTLVEDWSNDDVVALTGALDRLMAAVEAAQATQSNGSAQKPGRLR